MKTTLQLYCEFKKWQGGTIHEAMKDFHDLDMSDKDKFCNKVFNFGLSNVSDIHTFKWFTNNRIGL